MRYLRIPPNSDLAPYEGLRPFLAIVAIDEPVTPGWRWKVSKWLVANGCVYMMAWGIDCSMWDDDVDYADLEAHDYGDIPDDKFVMTTWHDKWPVSEVFAFAKRDARPKSDKLEFRDTILLHVSTSDREEEFQTLYAAA
jgi:hypothetical protein